MTTPERCWFCDLHLLRGDATRVLPGTGLLVHARCYEAATAAKPRPARYAFAIPA